MEEAVDDPASWGASPESWGAQPVDETPDAPAQKQAAPSPADQPKPTASDDSDPASWGASPESWGAKPDTAPAPEGGVTFAARKLANDALPTMGAMPAAYAGAELGGAAGALLGGVGAPVGAFFGGLAGAIGGGYAVSKAQDWVKNALGIDDSEQLAADQAAHPTEDLALSVVPAAALFRFDKGASAIARVANAGIMGGIEGGTELAQGDGLSPSKIGTQAAAGAVFTSPRALTEKLGGLGSAAVSKFRTAMPSSGGTATEQTPPSTTPADDQGGVGNPDSAPVRSDRDYGVSRPLGGQGIMTLGDMDPATQSALQMSLGVGELTPPKPIEPLPPDAQRANEEHIPVHTGIAEAAQEQAAPAQAAPNAPVEGYKASETGLVPPAATNAEPTTGFTTSKGSSYQVHDDGTTTRDKSFHEEHGPDGDAGIKPQSAKTVYVTRDAGQALGPAQGKFAIIDHGDGTLSTAHQNDDGKWGISDTQKNIPYSTEPSTGLHPFELFAPKQINGHDAYGAIHLGNDIVSTSGEAAKPAAESAKPMSDPSTWGATPDERPSVQSEEGLIQASQMQRAALKNVQDKVAAQNTGELPPATAEAIATSKANSAKPKLSLKAVKARAAKIDADASAAHPEPSPAQIEANNFRKGHTDIAGMPVSIENERGSIRRSKPGFEPPWEAEMVDHYGDIPGTKGADGDPIDITIGNSGDKHFIIDQRNTETGAFDEHKVFSHFKDEQAALDSYDKSFSDGRGPERRMNIAEVEPDVLKDWAYNGDKSKPYSRDLTPTAARPADLMQPKVVTATVKLLQDRGMNELLAKLQAMPRQQQAVEAARIHAGLTSKTGTVPDTVGERPRVRAAAPSLKVGDVEVTARSKADLARKQGSLTRLNDAFEKYAPQGEETRDQTRERLEKAVQDIGNARKLYRPNVKPKEWLWARDAEKYLKGSMSEKERQKFIANELQLRSGNAEDVENVRNTGRIDSDIGMSRRTGEDAVNRAAFDTPHEEAEEWVDPKPIQSGRDIEKPANKELDLTKPADLASAKTDSAKVSDNLIKAYDAKEKAAATDQRSTNMDKQRRAREAAELAGRSPTKSAGTESEGAASAARRIPLDDASVKAAMDALAKAEAKSKSRAAPDALPAEREPQRVPEESALKAFWNNESGELNLNKIKNQYRATVAGLKGSFEKYLGIPMSELGRKADAVLANAMSTKDNWNAIKAKALDARWYLWKKSGTTPSEVMKYLSVLENSKSRGRANTEADLVAAGLPADKASWMADEAVFHRSQMDAIYQADKAHGQNYDYVENYVSHIFEDQKAAMAAIEEHFTKTLGPRWFQKVRAFDTIQHAVDAGFKLKFDNPIDILNARWSASINTNLTLAAVNGLRNIGAAFPMKDAPEWIKKNWDYKVNLADGQTWTIAPEAKNLWQNSVEAKGLAEAQNLVGNVYRRWMGLKNLWTPIKLMLNAFHETHIAANINPAINISRALQLSKSDPANAGRYALDAVKWSMSDPLFSLPLDKIGFGVGKMLDAASGQRFSQFPGRQAQQWWQKPPSELNPDEKAWVQLFREGGVSPNRAKQDSIGAKRAWDVAVMDKNYKAMVPAGIRRGIEMAQSWMFEHQIPALKNIAYMRNVSAAFALDPSLSNDFVKRGVVLRSLGENLEDRYGEMFYDSMFWNKTLKDAGTASMLSLSWNVGQARQVAGFGRTLQQGAKMAGGENGRGAPMQEARYNAGDKGTFLPVYVGLSMLTGGVLTAALTGNMPSGLDYFFPRNGETNSDGTPQRLSPPFNTREPFMLSAHAQQHNSWAGGAMEFLWNKMVLEPIVEAWQNRDFYGNQMYDTNAPWYKRAAQLADSMLGQNLMPIGYANAQRAQQQGAGKKGAALSMMGFSPAPRYLEATPIENRIGYLFGQQGTAEVKPYQYGAKTGLGSGMVQSAVRGVVGDPLQREARSDIRQKLDLAIQNKDVAAQQKLRQELVTQGGMGKRTAGKIGPDSRYEYMFAKLPFESQQALVKNMSPQEFTRFVMTNTNGMSKPHKAQLAAQRRLNQ